MTELNLPAGGEQPAGKRLDDASWKAFGTGLLGSIVGYTCSFAIVLQGLRSAGATEAQAISGLVALSVGMGISGIVLAYRYRMPISVAWSTPGAALLIASGDTLSSVNEAIGTYLMSAVLLLIAGWFRPLGRLIEAIPASLANAMLAGVLLPICLAPVNALAYDAWLAMPLLLTWWLVGRINRFFAVPAALLVLVPLVAWRLGVPEDFAEQLRASLIPHVEFIKPVFDQQAMIRLGNPLFVVPMASQNVPGVAILRAYGYEPKAGPLILNTGFFSLLIAPFGALGINLAALTAAMFCSEDSHEDPQRRYWAGVFAGIAYLGWGMIAGVMGLFIVLVPAVMVEAIAGLALLGSFSGALAAALADTRQREASAITFLFAGSGLAFLGVGGAFWGLLVGAMMYMAVNFQQGRRALIR